MALTDSTMPDLGTPAPDFDLPDVVGGQQISLASFAQNTAVLVMFICRHCPFVTHVQAELANIGRDYSDTGLGIVAICANDAENYPADAPDSLREMAHEVGFVFPLCHDDSQQVARAYAAACTPDFFLYDADRKMVYRGQLDASRPGNDQPATGADLRAAIDAVLAGHAVNADQKPSVGCSIKWKAG